jgi:hypothetical protein
MNTELIEASERLGRQRAYGEMIDLLIAEKDKHEFGTDARNALDSLLGELGELVNKN